MTLAILMAAEFGPPIWRASEEEGLCKTEEACYGISGSTR